MLWAAAHPMMTVTQSGLGFLVSGSSAQLPRAPNRLPGSLDGDIVCKRVWCVHECVCLTVSASHTLSQFLSLTLSILLSLSRSLPLTLPPPCKRLLFLLQSLTLALLHTRSLKKISLTYNHTPRIVPRSLSFSHAFSRSLAFSLSCTHARAFPV